MGQGDRRAANYSIEFRTVAAESEWNAPSLYDAFYEGLSDVIKDELVAQEPPTDLDSLIGTAIRIDGHLQERKRERAASADLQVSPHWPFFPSPSHPPPAPGGTPQSM